MLKKLSLFAVVILLHSTGAISSAQDDVLTIDTFLSVDKIQPGQKFKLGVEITLNGKWHINSNKPNDEMLIPTVLQLEQATGFRFGEINYPRSKDVKFAFSETPVSVYERKALIWLEIEVLPSLDIAAGSVKLSGNLGYQACNDQICRMPMTVEIALNTEIVRPNEDVASINAERFPSKSGVGALQGQRDEEDNEIGALMAGKGFMLSLLFIFLGGLALNLTPCVYPIIPITVSFFVGQSSGKIGRSFFLAAIYVLGMSITYSALGVAAAMTGGLLGSSLQNPIVLMFIAAVFLAFAASMFGAFEIQPPAFLNQIAGGSRQGIVGSLLMGLTVGIVAAPCIGPFVLSLLTYVAAQGDPLTGFILFFVLSMGLGFPYLILGTFSGSVKNLPRSGEWMIWVKKVFGVIMIAMAVFFIKTLLPEMVYLALFIATLLFGGLYIGFIDSAKAGFFWFAPLKKMLGAAFIVFAGWMALSAWNETHAPHVDWQNYDENLVIAAKADNKAILIDFFADWCIPCKRIEKTIFSNKIVVEKSQNFLTLKADLTKENSEAVRNLRLKYNVRGVPTVILIASNGVEFKRYTDELIELSPARFAEIMSQAQAANIEVSP